MERKVETNHTERTKLTLSLIYYIRNESFLQVVFSLTPHQAWILGGAIVAVASRKFLAINGIKIELTYPHICLHGF